MAEIIYCWSCGSQNAVGSEYCGNCGVQQILGGSVESTGGSLEYAPFGTRLVAAIIDWILIWAIPFTIIAPSTFDSAGSDRYGPYLILAIPFVYHFVATAIWGRTLGKLILGLRVVSFDGTRVRLDQAFIREVIGKFLSTVILYLGFIWAAFNSEGKTWHDSLARIRVVYTDQQGAAA